MSTHSIADQNGVDYLSRAIPGLTSGTTIANVCQGCDKLYKLAMDNAAKGKRTDFSPQGSPAEGYLVSDRESTIFQVQIKTACTAHKTARRDELNAALYMAEQARGE